MGETSTHLVTRSEAFFVSSKEDMQERNSCWREEPPFFFIQMTVVMSAVRERHTGEKRGAAYGRAPKEPHLD